MSKQKPNIQVWIALAEVESVNRAHGFCPGEKAFVNALVTASTSTQAARAIRKALKDARFHTVSLEKPENWEERTKRCSVNRSLARLAKRVIESKEVEFGTFHTWQDQG